MSTDTQPVPGTARTRTTDQQHRLDPVRGILVSLGLGAAGWLMIAVLALGLRAAFG